MHSDSKRQEILIVLHICSLPMTCGSGIRVLVTVRLSFRTSYQIFAPDGCAVISLGKFDL